MATMVTAIERRRTRDKEHTTRDDSLYGFIYAAPFGETVRYVDSVPAKQCEHSTAVFLHRAPEVFSVVYRPYTRVSTALDDLVLGERRVPAIVFDLRRKVTGFARLATNWDNDGAEAVSRQTVATAEQLIEHVALVLERKNTSTSPCVRPFPDGSVFFKWIQGQKELAVTVLGRHVEVQRWEPLDTFRSQGLWQISIDDVSEHIEWVLT
ncbi:MAG TPA: hypothetical protein VK699_19925 [Terriglobales bacterium]|jgi:hypothetical protein|nr:hypothetical protein [Terriglobales bacterium]